MVFGLVKAESVRWGIAGDKHSDKGKDQNLKGALSHGEDFGLCSKAVESHWKGLKQKKVHLSCVGKAHSGCRLHD